MAERQRLWLSLLQQQPEPAPQPSFILLGAQEEIAEPQKGTNAMKYSEFAFTLLLMAVSGFSVLGFVLLTAVAVLLSQALFGGGGGTPAAIP